MTEPREVNVHIWITEPDGRQIDVQQTVPVPDDSGTHVLEALHSTVGLIRQRYEPPLAPAPPPPPLGGWTFFHDHTQRDLRNHEMTTRHSGPSDTADVLLDGSRPAHDHSWARGVSMGDPYRRCITCGAVEDA